MILIFRNQRVIINVHACIWGYKTSYYKAYQTTGTTNSQVTEKTISTGKTPNVIKLNKLQQIHKSQRKQLVRERHQTS